MSKGCARNLSSCDDVVAASWELQSSERRRIESLARGEEEASSSEQDRTA